MSDRVSPADLRLPADMLILYYLYSAGQGTPTNIAHTIDRNPDYVATRVRKLIDTTLCERVQSQSGPVTLLPAGVAFVERHAETTIPVRQRAEIERELGYSVTWRR